MSPVFCQKTDWISCDHIVAQLYACVNRRFCRKSTSFGNCLVGILHRAVPPLAVGLVLVDDVVPAYKLLYVLKMMEKVADGDVAVRGAPAVIDGGIVLRRGLVTAPLDTVRRDLAQTQPSVGAV